MELHMRNIHINLTNVLVRAWEGEHSIWGLTDLNFNPDHSFWALGGAASLTAGETCMYVCMYLKYTGRTQNQSIIPKNI